jgi:hypothetical protein
LNGLSHSGLLFESSTSLEDNMTAATASVSGPTTVTPGRARLAAAIDDAFTAREQRIREDRDRAEFAAFQAARSAADANNANRRSILSGNSGNASGITLQNVIVGVLLLLAGLCLWYWLFSKAPGSSGPRSGLYDNSSTTNGGSNWGPPAEPAGVVRHAQQVPPENVLRGAGDAQGQALCDKNGKGQTFAGWVGQGAARHAFCKNN